MKGFGTATAAIALVALFSGTAQAGDTPPAVKSPGDQCMDQIVYGTATPQLDQGYTVTFDKKQLQAIKDICAGDGPLVIWKDIKSVTLKPH